MNEWLTENYNPCSPALLKRYGDGRDSGSIPQAKQKELMDKYTKVQKYYADAVNELIYLGLAGMGVSDRDVGVGNYTGWSLTDFALEFMKYIEHNDEDLIEFSPSPPG